MGNSRTERRKKEAKALRERKAAAEAAAAAAAAEKAAEKAAAEVAAAEAAVAKAAAAKEAEAAAAKAAEAAKIEAAEKAKSRIAFYSTCYLPPPISSLKETNSSGAGSSGGDAAVEEDEGANPKKMASNPTSRLDENTALFDGCSLADDECNLMRIPYYFAPDPYPNFKIKWLRYATCRGFPGKLTLQECETEEEAERQWETQRKYNEEFLIHPLLVREHGGKYFLVFDEVFTLFKSWVQEHAEGRFTDADIWELLKKIFGENMTYLVDTNRPHGNLLEGIAVTKEKKPLFFNLAADTDALTFEGDAQSLKKILTGVESKLRTKYIKDDINKWIRFLETICSVPSGAIPYSLPHDYNAVHVRFVFNYPISWDVENKLRFLRNMYYLCTDRSDDLMKNVVFQKSLQNHYADWPAKVTNVSGVCGETALREVYLFGVSIGLYASPLTVPSFVLFAHNCIKHHRKNVKIYNKKHGTTLKMLMQGEVLAVLYRLFPYLIEHIYEAFYMAVTYGRYSHSTFTTAQILTGYLLL